VGLAGIAIEGGAQEKSAAAPADPAGTVPNAVVLGEKHAAMQAHSDRPLTGSVPAHQHNYAVTPSDRMFIRNNLLTPDLDATKHRIALKGLVDKELTFSVEQLQQAFKAVTTQAMLECAGSGRTAFVPRPSGTPWTPTGGMGCPKWTGARLRDVLQ